jgi:hypothetical protein
MPYLVQDIIDSARETYPTMSSAKGLAYLNRVRRSVLSMVPLVQSANTISITDGTANYLYAAAATRIQSARYAASATDINNLIFTSKDKLDWTMPYWRQMGKGRPIWIMLEADNEGKPQIRVVPTPNVTTDVGTGYPQIQLFDDINEDLEIGDTIYDDIENTLVYETAILKEWARKHDVGAYQARVADYETEMAKTQRYWQNKSKQVNFTLSPSWMTGGIFAGRR